MRQRACPRARPFVLYENEVDDRPCLIRETGKVWRSARKALARSVRRCNPGRGDRLQLVDHVQSLHELDGQIPAATD